MQQRGAPWSVTYHDGSANGFRFWQGEAGGEVRFEYEPVKAAMSSSGVYDGGEAKQGTLERGQIDELWRLVTRLEADESQHVLARKKGTGAHSVTTPQYTRRFLLERGSNLSELDGFMKSFRGSSKTSIPSSWPPGSWSKAVDGLQVQMKLPDGPVALDAKVTVTLGLRNSSAGPLRIYLIGSEAFRSFQSHFRLLDPAGQALSFQPPPRPHGYVVTEKDFHLIEPGAEVSFSQSVHLSRKEFGSADVVTIEWTYSNEIEQWQGGQKTLDGKSKRLFGGKPIPNIWLGEVSTSGTVRITH